MEYCLNRIRGLCGSRRRNKKTNNWYNSLYENVFLKIEERREKYDDVYEINPGFFEQLGYTRQKWNGFTKEGKIAVVRAAIKARQLRERRAKSQRAASPSRENERKLEKSVSLFRKSLEKGGSRKGTNKTKRKHRK